MLSLKLKDDEPNSIRHDIITNIKNKLLSSSTKFPDCSFLVGPQGQEHKIFHAIKAEMLISCFVMRNWKELLDKSMKNPVRIYDVTPQTFQLVLEFVHLNEIVSLVNTLDEAIDLAIAAKKLEVNFLDKECAILLEPFVTVSNVWTILDSLISRGLETTAQACSHTLTLLTTDCINNPSSLKVSEKSIMFALELPNYNVSSEKDIVDFCINWASKNPRNIDALRRFLPYLRLLTLTLEEAAVLPRTLVTADEKIALIETIVACDDSSKKPLLPQSLNTSTVSRGSTCGMKVVIIPDSYVDLEKSYKLCGHRISNTLWLMPKLDVRVTAIEILTEEIKAFHSEKGFKVTLKLVDRATKKFIRFQFASNQGSCVLQNNILSQWILKKDQQVCIKVVYEDLDETATKKISFIDVPYNFDSNQLLKSSQLPGLKKIHFAVSSGAPAFVKSISYAISNSVDAVGDENLPVPLPINDTSTEEEDVESDDEDELDEW